ncbi:MAG: SpoIIE family protein phosphatase [Bacteroidales bacterium]|nr:SpoIIE family protein phosphatase [Bacteroidales bacterium]
MTRFFLSIIIITLFPLMVAGQDDSELISKIDSLIVLIDSDKNNSRLQDTLINTVMRLDDAELQYSYTKKMLRYAEESGDPQRLLYALHRTGYFANMIGETVEGLDLTFRALNLADSLHDDKMISNCLLNIGSYYAEYDHDICLHYYDLAIEAANKINNYSDLELVYYDLALFFMDRDIYNYATNYMEKARDAYLKNGNITQATSTEYNLTIRMDRALYYFQTSDTINALAVLDSLNSGYDNIQNVKGLAGEANLSMGICNANLQALDICPDSLRASYLKYAKIYLDKLNDVIEQYNVEWLLPESYNRLHALYLMACGDYKSARKYATNRDFFNHDYDFLEVSLRYSKHKGDYRKALECLEFISKIQFTKLSVQTAANYVNLQSKKIFDDRIRDIQAEAETRDFIFREDQRRHNAILRYILVVFAVVLVIIAVFVYSHYSNNRITANLRRTHDEIAAQNDTLNRLNGEISSQTAEIISQSKIIEQQRDTLGETLHLLKYSFTVGVNIQRALVWDDYQLREQIGDSFVFWKPLQMVSGDFYWFSNIGGRDFLLVADCTGHGVPGALLSIYVISMLNDYVKRNANRSAAEILEIIKQAYLEQFVRGDRDFYDGMDCALVIIDRANMSVNYAGARRPLVQISDGQIIEHRPDKISIGNNPLRNSTRFTDHTISIRRGDMLYAFSDGIADQFGDEDCSTKFGNRQLYDILQEVSYLDTTIQKTVIQSVVQNWRTGAFYAGLSKREVPQLDDQLLIGVRV